MSRVHWLSFEEMSVLNPAVERALFTRYATTINSGLSGQRREPLDHEELRDAVLEPQLFEPLCEGVNRGEDDRAREEEAEQNDGDPRHFRVRLKVGGNADVSV